MLNTKAALNVVRSHESYGDSFELLRASLIVILEDKINDLQSDCSLNAGPEQEAWTERDWLEYEAELNTLNDKLRAAYELPESKLLQFVLGSI